jgi:hypothetical protein
MVLDPKDMAFSYVADAETGDIIEGVMAITWTGDFEHPTPRILLVLSSADVELVIGPEPQFGVDMPIPRAPEMEDTV